MDSVFKALSDPSRRQILRLLKKCDMSVGDIQKHFDFTGATLSHHLDILKRAELVVAERRGQFIFYSLNTSVLEDVLQSFYSLFSK
jgi:DNA-binding transcriptional ArsR family regulator